MPHPNFNIIPIDRLPKFAVYQSRICHRLVPVTSHESRIYSTFNPMARRT